MKAEKQTAEVDRDTQIVGNERSPWKVLCCKGLKASAGNKGRSRKKKRKQGSQSMNHV